MMNSTNKVKIIDDGITDARIELNGIMLKDIAEYSLQHKSHNCALLTVTLYLNEVSVNDEDSLKQELIDIINEEITDD